MLYRFLAAVVTAHVAHPAFGVMLTASVFDTPGMPGFQTYDLTVSADDGYVNAFDFFDGGISGPLVHAPDRYADDLFGGRNGSAADSHWLVASSDGVSIGARQSLSELSAAYTFNGASGQRDMHRSLPFVRLVTDDPSSVQLSGSFVIDRFWQDGSYRGVTERLFAGSLADIAVGPSPELGVLPTRPAPPTVAAPVIDEPPVVEEPPIAEEPRVPSPPASDPAPEPESERTPVVPPAADAVADIVDLVDALRIELGVVRRLPDYDVSADYLLGDYAIGSITNIVAVDVSDWARDLSPTLISTIEHTPAAWRGGVPLAVDSTSIALAESFVFSSVLTAGVTLTPVEFVTLSAEGTATPEPASGGIALLGVAAAVFACRR